MDTIDSPPPPVEADHDQPVDQDIEDATITDQQPIDQALSDDLTTVMSVAPDLDEQPIEQAHSDEPITEMAEAPDVDEQLVDQTPDDSEIKFTDSEREHMSPTTAMTEAPDLDEQPVDQAPFDEPGINFTDWERRSFTDKQDLEDDDTKPDTEAWRVFRELPKVHLPASFRAPTPAPVKKDESKASDEGPAEPAPPRRVRDLRNKRKREDTDTGRENSRPPPQQHREMPRRENFCGHEPRNRLEPRQYVWGNPPEPEDPSTFPQYAKHPRLSVPDPMDDSEEPRSRNLNPYSLSTSRRPGNGAAIVAEIERRRAGNDCERDREAKKAERRRLRRLRRESEAYVPPEDYTLAGFPTEVRERILRYLLVSSDAVPVFDSWTKVYTTTRHTRQTRRPVSTVLFSQPEAFVLYPAILRVCKQFFWEGCRILYGENKFLYRLRDAPLQTARPVVDVDKLATDDSPRDEDVFDEDMEIAEEENDSGSEYEDEDARPTAAGRRSARNGRAKENTEREISFDKYMPLMRQIVVEAEHNRYGEETKAKMSNAIKAFNERIQPDPKDTVPIYPHGPSEIAGTRPSPNIHTLTLRVHPQHLAYDEAGQMAFSFTEFFDFDSPVLVAARHLLPQFIRVELHTHHLVLGSKNKRMYMDLRPVRISRRIDQGAPDMWAGDESMMEARKEKLRKCSWAFHQLKAQVIKSCQKCIAEAQAESSEDDWDELDDEEIFGDF